MIIEDLVLSIEQMNHLKELGLKFKVTALCWCRYKSDDYSYPWNFCKGEDRDRVSVMEYVPTLTLQEIFEMLPAEIKEDDITYDLIFRKTDCIISYDALYESLGFFMDGTALENAYNMLCWVAENGYLNKE